MHQVKIEIAIQEKRDDIQKSLLTWENLNYRKFPWRENRTPYSILVSEVLLKRTTANSVNRIYEAFIRKFHNLNTLADASEETLQNEMRSLGYHKARAKIFHEISNYLLVNHKGSIPNKLEELLDIPHVGSYTANAVLTFGYNIPAAIVDTNVERILRRVFLYTAPKVTSLKPFRKIAEGIIPSLNNQSFNYALLDLGGIICISRSPKCNMCPIKHICDHYEALRS